MDSYIGIISLIVAILCSIIVPFSFKIFKIENKLKSKLKEQKN